MFSKMRTERSTSGCSANDIEKLRSALGTAEAVIVGAGAGLSASAGFAYSGERFEKNFADFKAEYGITDMYSGGFYPFGTPEEYWAWWSRCIMINRYDPDPGAPYTDLLKLIGDKDYFVLTTNVDHRFQLAGFDKKRLFYTQGDYGLFQCSKPCCNKTYDNEYTVRKMAAAQQDMKIPSGLVPYCPVCGAPMTMNLRADDTFVQDEGWELAAERYSVFLRRHQNMRTLFLELGTGYNTPGIIKFPFWQMTNEWKNAVYACVNLGEAYAPEEIAKRSICINGDISKTLKELLNTYQNKG